MEKSLAPEQLPLPVPLSFTSCIWTLLTVSESELLTAVITTLVPVVADVVEAVVVTEFTFAAKAAEANASIKIAVNNMFFCFIISLSYDDSSSSMLLEHSKSGEPHQLK